jgi:hypothetical protein
MRSQEGLTLPHACCSFRANAALNLFRPIRRRSRSAPVEVRVRKADSIPMRGCGQVGVVPLTLGSLGINTAVPVFCHKITIHSNDLEFCATISRNLAT